jgi:hypothetical protein
VDCWFRGGFIGISGRAFFGLFASYQGLAAVFKEGLNHCAVNSARLSLARIFAPIRVFGIDLPPPAGKLDFFAMFG